MEITDNQRRQLHRAGRPVGRLAREAGTSTDSTLRVGAFAPGGLSSATFEDALHAAVAAARAMSPSPAVHVPAGVWPMTRTLYVRGNGYTPMPTLIGEGRDVTILEWPGDFTGVCVELDGSRDHYAGGGLADISIRTANGYGKGVGLCFTHLLFTRFINVSVSGFCNRANDGWEQGVGIWARGNYGTVENSQNVLVENVVVSGCTTGARLAGCTQFTLNHVQFNQNHGFSDLVLEGVWTEIAMFGGMFQSQNDATNEPTNVYKGHDFCSIRTVGGVSDGTHAYAASGLNASLGAVVGGTVAVTGLTGMSPADVDQHLYFRNAASAGNKGLFEIVEYVSSTSVKVAKRNGGVDANNGTLQWEKYVCRGDLTLKLHGPVYHEGPIASFVRTSPSAIGTVRIFLDGVTVHGADYLADLRGTHLCEITSVAGALKGSSWVRARQVAQLHITGGPEITDIAAYDLDNFSQQRASVNGRTRLAGRSGLSNVLTPACTEIYDLSAPGAVSLVNGYVDSITGVNGSVMRGRGLWLARHGRLGGRPAVGCRVSGARTLSGALARSVPAGSKPGLFAIVHLPAGRSAPSSARRGARVSGARSSIEISIDDGVVSGPGRVNGFYSLQAVGNFAADAPLTRTMAILVQERGYSGGHALVVNGAVYDGTNFVAGSVDVMTNVSLGDADLDIAYLAVLKRPLTLEEEAAAFAEAAEYLHDTTAGVELPRTGAFTVESVVGGAPILVSLASVDAVASLPAEHQAGDKTTFIVTTPASSRTLTIKPAGSETVSGASSLVLDTDYATATLWSDGTNWWRVS